MIEPLFYVALFGLLGSWILIDPLPGLILLNFPEFIGRIAFVVYYNIVCCGPVVEFHVRLFPIRAILFYSDLIEEALIMSYTPLGGDEEDE